MSKKLTLRGKSVEVSNEDYDALAHLGAEIGIGVFNSVFDSESGKLLQGPQRGHAPRPARETQIAKHKSTEADRLHSVIEKMRELRGQK